MALVPLLMVPTPCQETGSARPGRSLPHICIIGCDVTLARRKTCFREGAGARPKGVAPSSAQVWVLSTALAEPKIVTLRWRSRRARRPPGRHFVCEHRREHSGNLPMA